MFGSKQTNDPVFGRILYRKPFFHRGFWQGKVKFAPTADNIDVYIVAGRAGIFPSQREFYQELEKRFPTMSEAICDELQDFMLSFHEYDWFKGLLRQDAWKRFKLERVLISDPKEQGALWELSFIHIPNNQSYTIYFDHWEPVRVGYDD
jgi:hypothetical protein